VLDGGPDPHRRVFVQRNGTGGSFAEAPLARVVWHPNWATVLPQNSSAVGSVSPWQSPLLSPAPNAGLFLPPCLSGFPR